MKTARRALAERVPEEAPRAGFLPTATMAKLLGILVVPVAVVATGVGVVATSYSAFSTSTSGPGSSWSTGNVVLANDAGAAAFTTTGLKPGSSDSRCIVVTSTGSLPASVKLYATAATGSSALASALNLTITQGTGGGGVGSCTGFTPGAAAPWTGTLTAFGALSGYSAGVLPWTTTGSGTQTQAYRITWTLPTDATSAVQGLTAGVTFTWEAQNT